MPFPRRLGLALSCAALLVASTVGSAFAQPTRESSSKPTVESRTTTSESGKSAAESSKTPPASTGAATESSTATPSAEQSKKSTAKQDKQEQKRGAAIAAKAREYVGYPYRWGGASPAGFDCSGFIMYIYGTFGLELGHDLGGQLASGRPIEPDQLQPGDLVIFQNTYKGGISHGGVYVGQGQFVHANDESTGVVVSSMGSSYWAPRYYGASRPGR